MAQELMTTKAVADAAKVDRSTVTRWVREGRLTPAIKVPGRTGANLFDAADVRRLIEQQRAA